MKVRRLAVLAVVVLTGAAVGLLAETDRFGRLTGVEGVRLQALDLRQRIAAERVRDRSTGSEIVLVLFDSASVRDWPYLSPFPRPFLAELIDALSDAGARTIGLDVFLGDLFPLLNELDGGDDLLEAALSRAGNVILVAPLQDGPDGARLVPPHPRFSGAAAGIGAAEIPTPFETVRDGVLAVRDGGGVAPSFALRLYTHALALDTDSLLHAARNQGRLSLPGLPERAGRIPEAWATGAGGEGFALSFPLRFHGPPSVPGEEAGTFPAFSASLVPAIARFQPDFFQDRIVLLGTGFHDSDRFRTPFYQSLRVDASGAPLDGEADLSWMYGVEVHANALQNLLDGSYIARLSPPAFLLLLLAMALASAGTVFWKGPTWGAIVLVGSAAMLVLIGLWAFLGTVFIVPGRELLSLPRAYLWFPVVSPLFASSIAYLGSTAYVAVVEGKEKRFIRGAFGKYVSPAVVEEIARSPETLRLGGQKRVLSVLFSDLAGFTSLSERLEPEALVALLNQYLSAMTRVVMDEGGTLDKYIGDAIMAFWNAPHSQSDHADRALRCALRMQERLAQLNAGWVRNGTHPDGFRVRIGVNTAEAVVGNVGGEDRFDYSAIGDGVNLAARLEPANDTYGTRILTSEHTLAYVTPGRFLTREVDLVAVKGRSEPVRIFEVLDEVDPAGPDAVPRYLAAFERGMDAYRQSEWADAVRAFQEAREENPDDRLAEIYLERGLACLENPPPADWDFVVQRTTK